MVQDFQRIIGLNRTLPFLFNAFEIKIGFHLTRHKQFFMSCHFDEFFLRP